MTPNTWNRGHVGSALVILGALSSLVLSTGCSSDSTRPRTPDRAEIGWIAPAPNDTLRASARLQAWVDLGEPVARVTFFVDGVEVAVRDAAPWNCTWRPADVDSGPELREIRLEVEAFGESRSIRHPPIDVWYARDDSPSLAVLAPGRTQWIEIAPAQSISVRAWDREDGELDASTVEWRTDEGRRFRGAEFPSQLLSPGERTVRATIADRFGNLGEAAGTFHAFRYQGNEDPLGAAQDFQAALSALDVGRLSDILDPDFQMESCGSPMSAGRPDPLSRAEFLAALGNLSVDPDLRDLIWGGQIQLSSEPSRGWAIARWNHLGVLVGRGDREWRTVGLSADLVLRHRLGEGWKVLTWRETGRGDGPGIPALMRSGLPYP